MHRLPLLIPLLMTACGGGGGGAAGTATLSGRITATIAAPLLASNPYDREPNDTAASARLGSDEGLGFLDASHDPIDAFRLVATVAGVHSVAVEASGLLAEGMLHELRGGRSGGALRLEPGDVYDVVIVARGGAGAYRYRVEASEADERTAPLPERYCDCGDGFRGGELIVAPADGASPEQIAAAAGLTCIEGDSRICRMRSPDAPSGGMFRDLCLLLARCADLERQRLARYAEPNYLRRLAAAPNDPMLPQQWGLALVRAEAAWDHTRGDGGVVVGTVDSGIRAGHPDLAGRVLPGWDFVSRDASPEDPAQASSHGTHVAGIIAAATNNATGVAGVLWDGRILPARAFDAAGFGSVFDIGEAIRFCAGLTNVSGTLPDAPARVINLSFASSTPTVTEEGACNAARDAGLFLCAAVGNAASPFVRYPANYESVTSVAATGRNGAPASYSNFGDWIDLAAPGGTAGDGIRVLSVNISGAYTYAFADGTSFACPHVAGVAALILGIAPHTPEQVKQILTTTAQDVGAAGYDTRTGHGLVDAHAAVLNALGLPAPLLIPGEKLTVRLLQSPTRAVVATTQLTAGGLLQWSMTNVAAGSYLLDAGTDRDLDGRIDDPGELYGALPDVLEVGTGASLANLDFSIVPR